MTRIVKRIGITYQGSNVTIHSLACKLGTCPSAHIHLVHRFNSLHDSDHEPNRMKTKLNFPIKIPHNTTNEFDSVLVQLNLGLEKWRESS